MKIFSVLAIVYAVIGFANLAVSQNSSDSSVTISCDEDCYYYWSRYGPMCASDGETYTDECVFTTRGLCSIPDLHKVYDGECSIDDTTAWEESLWCPPYYSLVSANCSDIAACYNHTSCSPGEGCCQYSDCSFRGCAELQSEPADCLDYYDEYGQKYVLKHGETADVGRLGCYADCHCHNGEIFCSGITCFCGGSIGSFSLLILVSILGLLLLGCLCLLKIYLMRRKRRRYTANTANVKNHGEIPAGTQFSMDRPPAYSEAVEIPVTKEHPPPTYDDAMMI